VTAPKQFMLAAVENAPRVYRTYAGRLHTTPVPRPEHRYSHIESVVDDWPGEREEEVIRSPLLCG